MFTIKYDRLYYDGLMKEISDDVPDKLIVMCGDCAMSYNGLSVSGIFIPDLILDMKELDGLRLAGYVNYYYIDNIDYTHYVKPHYSIPRILVPTQERSIIETIKYDLRFSSEMYFCDSLSRYLNGNDYNKELLEEVANHFGVPMSKVEYWIKESIDYNDY